MNLLKKLPTAYLQIGSDATFDRGDPHHEGTSEAALPGHVLCDAVYRDSASGKFTLLGIFDFLGGKRLPIEADFSVYICTTDALGDVPLAVRIVPADSLGEQPLAQVQGTLHAANPLAILQLTLRIKTASRTAGLYCELVSGDEVLMSRRLMVRLADGEGGRSDKLFF